MNLILFIPIILAFFITFIILPKWIKRARNAGLEGKDMNKNGEKKIAEAGGVIVIASFIISVLIYIAIKTFYFQDIVNVVEIFSLISSITIISFIGMIDDILGWKIGLGKRMRLLLVIIAAIPLMVINAGDNGMLGWIYPLIIIPVGILGASTTFNFLAGYNGLESGQGILILFAMSVVSYFTGHTWLTLIALCMVTSLLAFWIFNKYPARVFPGDVLTYSIGGLIAILAILGNTEKIAIFFFIPYALEVFLKLRGKLRKESFAKPNPRGSLDMPYSKIYGLEHLAICLLIKLKGRAYERDVVYTINLFQLIIIIIGFIIFRNSIFI